MDATKQIASDSIKKISDSLIDPARRRPLSEKEVETVLKEHLTDAFKQAGPKNRKALYNALSLNFHPDKFQNLHPELYAFLMALKMNQIPMSILNSLNSPDLFNQILANPVNGITSVYDYIYDKWNTFFTEHMRYSQPFQSIVKTFGVCLFLPVFVATFLLLLGVLLIQLSVKLLDNVFVTVLNFVSFNHQYELECNRYFDSKKIEELKKDYLDRIRREDKESNNILKTETMSDEELYEKLVNQDLIAELEMLAELGQDSVDLQEIKKKIEAQFIQKIINEYPVTGLTKIKLMFSAVYQSIKQPLPEYVTDKKWLSYALKPAQFAVLLVNTTASLVTEAIRYLNMTLLILAIGTATLSALTIIVLINSPLYLKDLFSYLGNSLQTYFNLKKLENNSDLSKSEASANNNGPKSMLALGLTSNASVENSPTPPQNYGGVIHSVSEKGNNLIGEQRTVVIGH